MFSAISFDRWKHRKNLGSLNVWLRFHWLNWLWTSFPIMRKSCMKSGMYEKVSGIVTFFLKLLFSDLELYSRPHAFMHFARTPGFCHEIVRKKHQPPMVWQSTMNCEVAFVLHNTVHSLRVVFGVAYPSTSHLWWGCFCTEILYIELVLIEVTKLWKKLRWLLDSR